jgi:hypothetical protein
MYSAVLTIHSWMRWLTLGLATAATINAIRPPKDGVKVLPGRWWDTFLMLAVDLQVFFGLVLYFGLSPFTKEAMTNMSLAMANPALRFWAVEHAGRNVYRGGPGEDGTCLVGECRNGNRGAESPADLFRDRDARNAHLNSVARARERPTAF